jgi:hypothetical protein
MINFYTMFTFCSDSLLIVMNHKCKYRFGAVPAFLFTPGGRIIVKLGCVSFVDTYIQTNFRCTKLSGPSATQITPAHTAAVLIGNV